MCPTYDGVAVADLLLVLVEDRLEAELAGGPGLDVDGVLEAEAAVVVGEEVADGSVVPAHHDAVGLGLVTALLCIGFY